MVSTINFRETPDIETSSDEYAKRFFGDIGSWFLDMQRTATLDLLTPYPNSKVLDVGGGHGQVTHALVQKGYDVTILGSSELCKKQILNLLDNERCSFQVGDILALPYPEQSFDIVISYRLLSHVIKWKRFVAELSRVARSAVILDYPSVRSVNYIAPLLFDFKKYLEGNTRPYASFQESALLEVFNEAGFTRTARYPQFFLPMVLHRTLGSSWLSRAAEGILRMLGLTCLFGSPVIIKLERTRG